MHVDAQTQMRFRIVGEGHSHVDCMMVMCVQYRPMLRNLDLPDEARMKACDDWSHLYPARAHLSPRRLLVPGARRYKQSHELLIEFHLTR